MKFLNPVKSHVLKILLNKILTNLRTYFIRVLHLLVEFIINLNSINLVFTERIEYFRFVLKSMKKYQDISKVF